MKVTEIGAEALKLGIGERADLAALILDSLEGADPNDSDEDSLTEAVRRGDELRSGVVQGIAEREFMAQIRASRAR
jgi:putative addiction module component (TIGR02574 family)